MKTTVTCLIAALLIVFVFLQPAPSQASPTLAAYELNSHVNLTESDPQLPAGLNQSEWQSIQNQILGSLSQQAYLKASNTNAYDYFGWSMAISNDTLIVGAYTEDSNATGVNGEQSNNSLTDAGAAYVFTRSDTVWTQQAYLKASNPNVEDLFGYCVAIDGDTIVVSAVNEDSGATGVNGDQANNFASNAGAAYVFTRVGSTWTQQAYLKASNTEEGDEFGRSVAISGNTIVVGAPSEDSSTTGVNSDPIDNYATSAGAAYVFIRKGTTWSQQAYLKASNTNAFDRFGGAVAITDDTIVIGAASESSNATIVDGDQSNNAALNAGAAYVFLRADSTWTQQAYLKASNTDAEDNFGYSIAISGDTVVVGAPYEASGATGVNSDQSNNSATDAGAVYVFVRAGSIWSQQAYLKASNTGAGDRFGISFAIAGNLIVVGAFGEDSSTTGVSGDQSDNSANFAGAAYVYSRSGSVWSQQSYLKASNTNAYDAFGWSTAISGNTIVVGADWEASASTGVNADQSNNTAHDAGAAYVFAGEPPTLYLPLIFR